MKIEVICNQCGKIVIKEKSQIRTLSFCNRDCQKIYFKGKPNLKVSIALKGKFVGDKNPNFGNKWDDDKKTEQSIKIKSKVDAEYRLKCSSGMKGKKVSKETKEQKNKTMLLKYGRLTNNLHPSVETKKLIGQKSKEKFTPEFKLNFYNTMVEKGLWQRKEDIEPYNFYKKLANWDYHVFGFPIKGIELLNIFKLYSNKNTKGLVRDHRFSRKSGFELKVFPEILKHPVNCELISHSDNVKKQHTKNINSDSISLETLFDEIIKYEHCYIHQKTCINLINLYRNGEFYKKENYYNYE